jgi:drug/metabolite transporter (DMT)-like permease
LKNSGLTIPLFFPLTVGIIAISFSSIFIKISNAPVSVQGMYRLLFTVLFMFPFMWRQMNVYKKITRKDYFLLFFSGLFLSLHFLFWMGSLKLTTVASSTIILSLQPIFVLIGAYLVFREKTTKPAIVSMSVAIIGAIFVGWGDIGVSYQNIQGDALSILGTAAVAVHMLIGQKLLKTVPASVYSFVVFLTAVLIFSLYNLALSIPMTGYSEKEWGIFILLAVVPTVFGHVLFNWLLKYVTAATISMAILGEPVGASLLAYILLGEKLSVTQWLGGVIVITGLYFFLRSTRNRKKSNPPAPVRIPVTTGPIVKKG